MNELIVSAKTAEFVNNYTIAAMLGNREKMRKWALASLVMLRQESRVAHAKAESLWSELRATKRDMKKMAQKGVTFPLGEQRIKKLSEDASAAQKLLAHVGEEMSLMLDLWQQAGATFEDLCNLCNRDPAQVRRELGPKELDVRPDASFSKLSTAFNLDYKDPRNSGWLEDCIDAPLTHALKAYMTDLMLHTEAGKKAAHEAMNAVFPEIMENALRMVTDADGVRRLIDKDGEIVATLDGEEETL